MPERVALYLQDSHDLRKGLDIVRYAEQRGFEAVWQAESRLVREEIFGPVTVIQPFDDAEAVLAEANDSEYGLTGAADSKNPDKLREAADTFLSDRSEYYVTGGWRFGNVLPTLTYGRRDNDAKTDIIGLLPNVPALAPLRAGVTGVVFSDSLDDEYVSLGLRWDFSANMAFKADYTRFTTNTPGQQDADALAAGLVFTF